MLLVTLGSAAYRLGLDENAPEIRSLRDRYLAVWSDLGTRHELDRSADLAIYVTKVSRALAWQRALRDAEHRVEDDVRTAVADWLAELVEP